jgi:hypothetical protein
MRLSESPAATSTTQAGSNTGSAGTNEVGTVGLVGATLVVVVASTVAGGLVVVDGGELVVVLTGEEVAVMVVVVGRGTAAVDDDSWSVSELASSLVSVGIRVADPPTTPSSVHALAIAITPTNTAIGTRLTNMHRGYARLADVWRRPAPLDGLHVSPVCGRHLDRLAVEVDVRPAVPLPRLGIVPLLEWHGISKAAYLETVPRDTEAFELAGNRVGAKFGEARIAHRRPSLVGVTVDVDRAV